MKLIRKIKSISSIVALSLIIMTATPIISMAETINTQPTVNLGTTASFAVLAGSTITSTGNTTINGSAGGDVGIYPGTVFSGQDTAKVANGAIHLSDAIAIKAKDDLVTAYDDAVGRTPVQRIPTELGGTTLKPGSYDSADGTFQVTGTLTLDAEGDADAVFLFKTASTLITATDSNIVLKDKARFCRTFWVVGSSATLGTNSYFVGHIFAMQSITVTTGAEIQGQLLARNGAVTLDNNTITNGICETAQLPPEENDTPEKNDAPASLHIIKHVINDDGGKSVASDFNIHVMNSNIEINQSPAVGAESPGTKYTLLPGTYKITEDNSSTYLSSYSGDSDSNGNITLASGDNKTITITNDDIKLIPVITPTIPVVEETTIIIPVPKADTTTVPAEVITTTVNGGQLPYTSTGSGLYYLLIIGVSLTIIGAVAWRRKKYYE